MLRCMHTFSQFYQGLSQEFASPTFQKYHFPTPSRSVVAEFWARMPYLHATRQLSASAYAEWHSNLDHVRWQMDKHDLAELRSALSLRRQNGPLPSRQDCLIAYLVSVLNYSRRTRVRKVTNTISASQSNSLTLRVLTCFQCRDVPTSFLDGDAASSFLVDVRVFHPFLRSMDRLTALNLLRLLPMFPWICLGLQLLLGMHSYRAETQITSMAGSR